MPIHVGRAVAWPLGCLCLWLILAGPALATPSFQEVSTRAGVTHAGPSFGASWGDLNGDGWPDLWVGNHNTKPTLYLNMQNGSFTNVIDQVWSDDPKADTHGAAWADLDNDGDQDLAEMVGARENPDGTFCVGCGKNHLYINDGGRLLEKAAQWGLDHPGEAKMPLWFDANRDGLLDLLVVNTTKGSSSSTIYLQGDGRFEDASDVLGFRDGPLDRYEKVLGIFGKLREFSYPSLAALRTHKYLESAQLADLSVDGVCDLVVLSVPSRVFRVDRTPFDNISHRIGLPDENWISDAALADFNGDQRIDIYAVRGSRMPSDVVRTSPREIKGRINNLRGGPAKGVRFKAAGQIHLQVYPTWVPLAHIFIGSSGRHPESRAFVLSPDDAAAQGPATDQASASRGVSIAYDRQSQSWTIENFSNTSHIDFIARATESISDSAPLNFKPFAPDGTDALLINGKDGFARQALQGGAGMHTACYVVAAADFDNDMDVDLYQTCTGPVANLPNRLLANDGKGNFELVADAGGAAGSLRGRGDAVALADYDRDGFIDIFITNGRDPTSPFVADGPHQLFRNLGNDNHWLEIDLKGTQSNRDGIGARVELQTGDVIQVREQSGGMHRICQNHQRLHFGLAGHRQADRVTVTWPSGTVQHLHDVAVDQILHIEEPSPPAKG